MTAVLELDWSGPWRPAADVIDEGLLDDLSVACVYACLYDHAQAVRIYVGVSGNFATRLREHIGMTLALRYPLHDADARVAYQEADRTAAFAALGDLERLQAFAADDVRRMSWYLAAEGRETETGEPPHWAAVEGVLIDHLRGLAAAGATDPVGRRILVDNLRAGASPETPVRLVNRGPAALLGVLGETVSWPGRGRGAAA